MLFTLKNVAEIQQVVFQDRIKFTAQRTKRASILYQDDTVMYLLTEVKHEIYGLHTM